MRMKNLILSVLRTCLSASVLLANDWPEWRGSRRDDLRPALTRRMASRFDQPDRSEKESWPHPVIANGMLCIRDQDTLLCFKVAKS